MFQLSKWWAAFVYRYSSTSPEKETSYFLFSADYRVKEDMQHCWTLFSNLFRISVRIRSTRTLLIFLQLFIVLFATSSNVQTVYLSDEESNIVAIKFWEGLKVLINSCFFGFVTLFGGFYIYVCIVLTSPSKLFFFLPSFWRVLFKFRMKTFLYWRWTTQEIRNVFTSNSVACNPNLLQIVTRVFTHMSQ